MKQKVVYGCAGLGLVVPYFDTIGDGQLYGFVGAALQVLDSRSADVRGFSMVNTGAFVQLYYTLEQHSPERAHWCCTVFN